MKWSRFRVSPLGVPSFDCVRKRFGRFYRFYGFNGVNGVNGVGAAHKTRSAASFRKQQGLGVTGD